MKLSLTKILEGIIEEGIPDDNKKGKMFALPIPIEVGSHLQQLFSDVPGEKVEEKDMHITIALVRDENKEAALDILKSLKTNPVKLSIRKFGVFPPHKMNDGKHVLHAKPDSESIHKLHQRVFELAKAKGLNIDNGNFEFNPHITLKYCDEVPDVNKDANLDFLINKIGYVDRGKKYLVKL